ncbi:MAG: adenine deaminase [Deltaproteobacteria bacterium]|nr:adenine deaminase [Deltaproteobacteria bacterium]
MSRLWREGLEERLAVARGEAPAELVLTGARVVNVFDHSLEETSVAVHQGWVVGLGDYQGRETHDLAGAYLAPGFIEGHMHVESTMLCPAELARAVAPRGTAVILADPHEIANVLGAAGVAAMLAGSENLPVTFYFLAPSCVPASPLADSGAVLEAADLAELAAHPRVVGLAEMMNFPGAAGGDPGVLAKLAAFHGRPIDGHAPLVSGKFLNAYLTAGPDSDHECAGLDEAREKLARGMWLMIRQGTSAHNLADLLPAVTPATARRCLLVSDDRHPTTLAQEGHLDDLLRRAVAQGLDPFTALSLVTLNPARRFGLAGRGAVAPGYVADLVVLEDLRDFRVRRTYQAGRLVARDGRCLHPADTPFPASARDSMHPGPLTPELFRTPLGGGRVRIIELVPGQLLTNQAVEEPPAAGGFLAADPARDLALAVVLDRHHASGRRGLGLVRGLGIISGALAASVAHDSHNLGVVGTDEASLLAAATRVAEMGGGMAVAQEGRVLASLALPLAGLMSAEPLERVAAGLAEVEAAARGVCRLENPQMPLSFLSLEVIPHLKLTARGLVDVDRFAPVELFLP